MEEKNTNGSEKSYEDLIKKYSGEYTEKKDEQASAPADEIVHDRSDKVKSFSLNFDAEKEIPSEPAPHKNTNKGVYFAAYSGKKSSADKKKASAEKPADSTAGTLRSYYNALKKNTLAYTLTFIALILLVSAALSTYIISCANDILAFRGNTETVTVSIPDKATTGQVIDILHDNDLINHSVFCKFFAKVMGYEDNYLTGVYYLNTGMGLEGMLRRAKEMDMGAETVDVPIPEGYSISQIAKRLEEYEVCDAEIFLKSLEESEYKSYPFLAEAMASTDRFRKMEGFVFPATYNFYVNEAPASVIKKFFDAFSENIMTDKNIARAKELGLTMDEVVTIASIIQREAANNEQMYLVSSVIHNRLKSPNFPHLQCEAVDYYYITEILKNAGTARANELFGGYSGDMTEGLPNGPICNPGAKAIDAALNPEKTDYFYFRHDKKGKIYMARTQAEHDDNFRRILNSENNN